MSLALAPMNSDASFINDLLTVVPSTHRIGEIVLSRLDQDDDSQSA